MGDISKITLGMVDSVLAEHKLSKDINIVPCASLTSPHLQVNGCLQDMCIAHVHLSRPLLILLLVASYAAAAD